MARNKGETDRQRIIRWYKDDIFDYNQEIGKLQRLIRSIQSRIEELEIKEMEENDIKRRLPQES